MPWDLWDDPSVRGTPLALVAAAVLSANPHDTQPWLFRIGEDTIEMIADLSRNLGAMDAFAREMHLVLACAIETMMVAAGPNGYDAEVIVVEGSLADLAERSRPVATAMVHLRKQAPRAADAFYRAIPLRHTNRYAYQRGKALPPHWLDFLRQTGADQGVRIFLFDEGAQRREFDAAVVEATRAIIDDKVMIADSDRWFRSSSAEIDAHRDGPTLDAAGLSFVARTYSRFFPVAAGEPRGLAHGHARRTTRLRAANRPYCGPRPLRSQGDAGGRAHLADAAPECDGEWPRHATAKPADRDDRPRTPVRAGRPMGEAHRPADGRRLASHLLVPRGLRHAVGAAEPQAQASGCRAGMTRTLYSHSRSSHMRKLFAVALLALTLAGSVALVSVEQSTPAYAGGACG